MQIVRNIPEQLIIENNPKWVGVMLTGMALAFLTLSAVLFSVQPDRTLALAFAGGALIPLGFLLIFVRRAQLIFEAGPATLTWQRKNMFTSGAQVFPLSDVQGAELQTDRSPRMNKMLRVALIIAGRKRPVTLFYSNVGDHDGVTRAINAWLDSQRARA